jgi:hypothetical protein
MAKSKKGMADVNPERKDYWDSIAEDVSKGYGATEVKKTSKQEELLNEDQQPDDEKRGDS